MLAENGLLNSTGFMNKKILVTYASRTGTTTGVAEEIKNVLSSMGFSVDLLPIEKVSSTEQYGVIIAGSPIQSAGWLPEALAFLEKNKDELRKKQFATFQVCMTLAMKNPSKYLNTIRDWLEPVRRIIKPFSEGIFAGRLNIKEIPSADRMKFRISVLLGVWKEGDHRNWEEIRLWAEQAGEYIMKNDQ